MSKTDSFLSKVKDFTRYVVQGLLKILVKLLTQHIELRQLFILSKSSADPIYLNIRVNTHSLGE